jgi:hypothetical protein
VFAKDGQVIDLVELGIARFLGGTDHNDPWFITEPIAVSAILNFCKEKKPIEEWLTRRWNTSAESRGYVYEDIVIHRLYQLLSQEDGCSLDSILDFAGDPPSWASTRAKLVALRQDDKSKLQTVPVTSLTLPYACSASTWEETVMWFAGGTVPIPFCSPDKFMGPDLLCFVELQEARRLDYILLGFQMSSGSKAVAKAARTVDPDLFWMMHVSMMHDVCHPLMLIVFGYTSETLALCPTRMSYGRRKATSVLR